ncbi:MAG: hypothetical protein J2P46_22470 [Zavarzinella sp.]|nr:hypothetical protein [Zavarzinella sp.]
MRKLMAAAVLALPLGAGCTVTGGVCDCAPVPGDSTGFNPHVTYHATCPGGGCPPAPVAPVAATLPVSATGGDALDQMGPPRMMPRSRN